MRQTRNSQGSALAEFGPALGIFLLGFFFPVIDMCGLYSSYASCIVLNSVQCREAAMLSQAQVQDADGLIRKHLPQQWAANGLGRFAAIKQMPVTSVTYSGSAALQSVTIRTSCTVNPWLQIPLPVPVAGMNAPITFTIEGYAPVESATDKK